MTPSGSNKKVAHSLVAVSCAAVLSVYTAGYVRTRSAAAQFEVQAAERRTAVPQAPESAAPIAELTPEAAAPSVAPPTRPEPIGKPRPTAAAEPERTVEVPQTATVLSPPETAPPLAIASPAPALVASAPEPRVELAAPAPPPPAPKWKDGTYFGWGTSRHGDIQAQVVIEGGRIQSATIAQCRTRYPCSVIEQLPPQVAQRQSPDVDYVSRATQSADAFYFAVVEALGKAK